VPALRRALSAAQGAVESAIDLLRDRMDPNMADLDQAIPQWVFQRAKARERSGGAHN